MSEHFNETQIEELKDAFKLFDSDNDGKINGQDVAKLVAQLGLDLNESQINLKESLDFNGFLNTMSVRSTKSLNDKEIDYKSAFSAFDKGNKGNINRDDIAKVLSSINETITATEIDEIIKYADVSGDGMINYEEFVKLMVEGV